jgi:O-antigen ligase
MQQSAANQPRKISLKIFAGGGPKRINEFIAPGLLHKEMKKFIFFKKRSMWAALLPLFIGLYLLFSMVSISVSQIAISLALVCWIIILIRKEQIFSFPSFFWPLIVYSALSLISSFLSVSPKTSLKDSRELLLFLIVPIVYIGLAAKNVLKKVNLALLASGYLNCLYAIFYFIFKAHPGERIKSFMGQVMTQGGLLMLFSCMALSMLLLNREKIKYLWGLGLILSLFALILTQTRSAWLGLVFSVSLILLLYKPRAIVIVPILIGLFYLLSPHGIKNRALSSFSIKDSYNEYRIEYLRVGIKIIKEFPIFGTGPDTVDMVFQNPKYGLSEEAKKNVHLHNDILQTGAERGIPTLIAWLAFIVWLFLSLLKLLKNKDPSLRPFTVAALAALLGLFVAGLFEYNFADSEITMLFLYIITVPFSFARLQEKRVES